MSELAIGAGGESGDWEKDALELVSLRHWLDNQLLEYQATITAAKDDTPVSNEDPEVHINRLCVLKQELLKASQDHCLHQMILDRLALTQTLTANLFPDAAQQDAGEVTEAPPSRHKIQQLAEEQRKLVSQVMKVHKEIEETKPVLETIKQENRESIRGILENREDMRREKKQLEQQLPETIHKAQESLSTTRAGLETLRNVFQGVVMGSGINWAQDPAMLQLVLMLGEPLEEVEKHGS